MPNSHIPVSVESAIVHATFQVGPKGITLGNLASQLNELNEVLLNLWSAQRDLSELSRTNEIGEPIVPDIPQFDVIRIRYESPLELILGARKVPKHVWEAVIAFLKGLVFHEETRQRLAAESARAWEGAYQAQLKNVENAIRIARALSHDKQVDREILGKLLSLHNTLPYGELKLTAIETREEK